MRIKCNFVVMVELANDKRSLTHVDDTEAPNELWKYFQIIEQI